MDEETYRKNMVNAIKKGITHERKYIKPPTERKNMGKKAKPKKTGRRLKLEKIRGDEIYYVVLDKERLVRIYLQPLGRKPDITVYKNKVEDVLVLEE